MTDAPTPPIPTSPPVTPKPANRAERPGIVNADVPSDTLGLPGVGEGASAAHYARDSVQGQMNDGDDRGAETRDRAPADDRDAPGTPDTSP